MFPHLPVEIIDDGGVDPRLFQAGRFRSNWSRRSRPRRVVQYRGEILPLLDVSRLLRQRADRPRRLRSERATEPSDSDAVQVVVYASGGRQVGLVVAQILDIVEEELASRARATRPGVRFTAVVQGRRNSWMRRG